MHLACFDKAEEQIERPVEFTQFDCKRHYYIVSNPAYNNCMRELDTIEKMAVTVTRWVGSGSSLVIHTLLFAGSFLAVYTHIVYFDRMLLILTTVVSLEAIYLAVFIQMTLNLQGQSIAEVSADVGEIHEDVGEIQEDVEELQGDVEDISVEEFIEESEERQQQKVLASIRDDLQRLIGDVDRLKNT